MGRVVISLNDTKIKNSKPKEKDYTLSDGNGLQLLIKTTGAKLWEFYYTSPKTYKRRKTSLGSYPNVSLVNARKKRTEYQNHISSGSDPIDLNKEKKQKAKEEENQKKHTIGAILEKCYDRLKLVRRLKESTILKDKQRIINHFINNLPKKENTVIHDITFEQSIKILSKLEELDKLETLLRVKNILVRVLKYAYSSDIIKSAELFGKIKLYEFHARKKEEIKNNPTLTSEHDIKKIYNDILNYENNLITKYLMIFTIHTSQRQRSLITAKWCDIDFENKLWIIHAEQMKMKKKHILPLSEPIIKYLKELYSFTSDFEYLFPNSQINKTRNKYPHISNNTVTKALRLMGYTKEQQTAHGFRAMFKTVCKENQTKYNLQNEFVERVLAHKITGDTEEAYNRAENIDDMRTIVNWWGDYLERLKG